MKLKLLLALSLATLIALLLQFEPSRSRDSTPESELTAPTEFIISGAKLFDGQRWQSEQSVWVKDGLIHAVGDRLDPPDDIVRIDGTGHSLLPGLIDAHVHTWGPAREQLLRFGVTSALDMFSASNSLAAQREQRTRLGATTQADLWSAGSLVTAAGGHGTQYGISIDTLDHAEDAAAMVQRRVKEGSDYIKIVYDNGHAYSGEPQLPTLDRERLKAVIGAAHAAGLLAVVHVSDRAAAAEAVELGADGLVHVFHDQVLDLQRDGGWIERWRQRDGFVIATLSVIAGMSEPGYAEQIQADPALAPYLDSQQKQGLGQRFPSAMQTPEHLANALANVRLLHQAGIQILAGSDSPNPATAHGASLHGELQLLIEAGLSHEQALAAATATPARVFGLGDRGRIAPGLRADLLLLAGDPGADITASRRIDKLWKNGLLVARQAPAEQLAELRAPASLSFDFSRHDDWQAGSADSRWVASSDQIMGGQSSAEIDRIEAGLDPGALRLRGEVRSGAPYPFASAMLFLHPQPMQPVDARHWRSLRFQARGSTREFSLLLFSGDGQPPIPFSLPFQGGSDWQAHTIDLDQLSAVDRGRLRAIGFAAGQSGGAFELQIDQVVLQ
ncbi:CIA30 family protein [Pseudomarimonas arenosa]|uniref:CIA30 family protein n=1 Tax=Pseudomarimonas arenosa TaxID=2774145 RepID=A0AAW3ZSG1_9GAMM|nr:CIA30 family protein [Pseudomarimonas arenosa]MBD8528027.1 CIA30 family protein [Pseudomarimonas arenosa]